MYKVKHIMPLSEIQDNLLEIQEFISIDYDADNGHEVIDRAKKIEQYMALTGKMLADAKFHKDEVYQSNFVNAIKSNTNASPSTLNKYLDSLVRDYQYLVDWCDRLNRTCTHQLDFSRTLISKLKAEMQHIQG